MGFAKEQIIGHPKLEEFGAVFSDSIQVSYIDGVTKSKHHKKKTKNE